MDRGYKLDWQERREKASDVIGFLAAWGLCRKDAENILAQAYGTIREMGEGDFISRGGDLLKFMAIMQQPNKEEQH